MIWYSGKKQFSLDIFKLKYLRKVSTVDLYLQLLSEQMFVDNLLCALRWVGCAGGRSSRLIIRWQGSSFHYSRLLNIRWRGRFHDINRGNCFVARLRQSLAPLHYVSYSGCGEHQLARPLMNSPAYYFGCHRMGSYRISEPFM